MAQKFANNFITTLSGNILAGDLLLPLTSITGLPAMAAGDYFYGALVNSSNALEFFICNGVSGSSLVIPAGGRGIGGSTAIGYTAGDVVRLVLISDALLQLQQEACTAIAATGTDTYAATYSPALRGYVTGLTYFLTVANTNLTTTPTLNLNALGAKNIVAQGGVAVAVGAIQKESTFRYDGTNMVLMNGQSVPAGVSLDFMGTVIPAGYLGEDGSNQTRAALPGLDAAINRRAVVTVSINTPAVVGWVAHGLSNGDVFKAATTGALPTGITAGLTHFVINAAADTFQLSLTEGGVAINTSGGQSGVHTGIHSPWGDGNGTTTFTLPDTRRRVLMGRGGSLSAVVGARLGASGGEEAHVQTVAEMAAHAHAVPLINASVANGPDQIANNGGATTPSGSTGSSAAANIMQPVLVVTKIIKT